MMINELKRFFKHMITHWVKSGLNGYGKPAFASPVAIDGRWQDQQVITRAAIGVKEIVFASLLYTEEALAVGDYVAEGTYTGADPLLISTAKEVKIVSKSTDIAGRHALYTGYLKER